MKARPTRTASAPHASALSTSVPDMMPPSISTCMRRPTAARMAGRTSMVAGDGSNWRPPWLDTTTPSSPIASAFSASAGCMTPFSTIARGQLSRMRARVSHVTAEPARPVLMYRSISRPRAPGRQ